MADVKWIKILTDIFDDEKILLIETLPEADSIIVIWFKILCLAGKQNNSGVFVMNERMPYNEKMFATIFRRKESTVQLALKTFEEFGMIEIIDGAVTIPNWGKHQNLDKIEAKNEYMKGYMREYREKQKQLVGNTNSSNTCKTNSKSNSKSNVRQADKNRLDENRLDENIYVEVVDYLNNKIGSKYKATAKPTREKIHARVEDGFTLDNFKTVIDKKADEWIGTEQEKFLRPETLFGTKFEGYLNQNIIKSKKQSSNPFLEMLKEGDNEQNGNEAVTGDSCDSIPKLLQG